MRDLKELSKLVKGKLNGNSELKIRTVNSLDNAGPDEIAIAVKPEMVTEKIRAGALVVTEKSGIRYNNLIYVDDPFIALSILITHFFPVERFNHGVGKHVSISGSAAIGEGCSFGDQTYVGENVKVGKNCEIHSGVKIYNNVRIGDNALIYSNVVIREDVIIGDGVVVQPGAVIGSDGFGFARDNEGKPLKIPQRGNVVIGDNCEIGANVCIDRSTLDTTYIADSVKIDNLVQIGHNVKVGESTSISAQSGISGSTEVGKNVIMAGQVGLADHIKIGNGVMIAAKAGISGNVKDKSIVAGIPQQDLMSWKRSQVILRNIEKYIKRIKILEDKIGSTEEK
ncbi:MAG: UDP-3-O-(3-hydroxymyristoyl)glucosamine N-acyltransferase [Acidobacteriota bacterium]